MIEVFKLLSDVNNNDRFKQKNYVMVTLKSELFVRIIRINRKHQSERTIVLILEKKKILESGLVDCVSENKLGTEYWKAIQKGLGNLE